MRPSKCARITFSKVPFLRETKRLLSTDYALFDGRLSKPELFMTVRREIAEPRCESGARSLEDLKRTRAVC